MKKKIRRHISILLYAVSCMLVIMMVTVCARYPATTTGEPPPTVRRTVLTDSDGNIINQFDTKNLNVSTIASIDIDLLEETTQVLYNNSTALATKFRNNNGTMQYQNNGASWENVGAGGGMSFQKRYNWYLPTVSEIQNGIIIEAVNDIDVELPNLTSVTSGNKTGRITVFSRTAAPIWIKTAVGTVTKFMFEGIIRDADIDTAVLTTSTSAIGNMVTVFAGSTSVGWVVESAQSGGIMGFDNWTIAAPAP